VYFKPSDVRACIVTCGGLCPGLNTVIREIVCGLHFMYGVTEVIGVDVSSIFVPTIYAFRLYFLGMMISLYPNL